MINQNETERIGLAAINILFFKRLNRLAVSRPDYIIKKHNDNFYLLKEDNKYLFITYAIDTKMPVGFSFFKVKDKTLLKKLQTLQRYQPIITTKEK